MKTITRIALGVFLTFILIGFLKPVFSSTAVTITQKQQPKDWELLIDGVVTKKIQVGNVLFIAGNFKKAKLNNSQIQYRKNMVILNMKDKKFANWQIDTDAPILDMVIKNSILAIAGPFNNVNGVSQKNIAFFDIKTHKKIDKSTGTNAPVLTLDSYQNTIYIGGAYTKIGASDRTHISAFDTNSRELISWSPKINGAVNDMAIYNNRLYIAGEFTQVNDTPKKYTASFILPTNELTQWSVEAPHPFEKISIKNRKVVLERKAKPTIFVDIDTTDIDKKVSTLTSEKVLESEKIEGLRIKVNEFGFKIPTLGQFLTFSIRAFFVIAGLAGIFNLLLGALAWITSGGSKDAIQAAREKIQAAIIGMILIVAVFSIVWTLEQVVFNRRICIGVSCPLTLPSLIQPN